MADKHPHRSSWGALTLILSLGLSSLAVAADAPADTKKDSKVSGDNAILQQSVRSTKSLMDREMLDQLYHDAQEAYHDHRYDEALEGLNQIIQLNPNFRDASQLRRAVEAKLSNQGASVDTGAIRDYMRQGDSAVRAGQNALAISYWKKALDVNPHYAPALRQIARVNKILAQKEYDQGYIYYHQNDPDNALDSWSNAIALDPTYRKKGLLVLMSKVEIDSQRDQVNRLRVQGFDQYQKNDLENALQTFEQLVAVAPRDEEAKQMTAKIKIHIGKAALDGAQKSLAERHFSDASKQADKAIAMNYEVTQAQRIKTQAGHPAPVVPPAKPVHTVKRPSKPVEASTPTATAEATEPAEPPPPAAPRDPEGAMVHYRKGLAAIRTKEYRVAIQELDAAWQMDPSNERIYLARERAHQEGAAMYDSNPPGESQ